MIAMILLLLVSNFSLTFAYWASSVTGNTNDAASQLDVGDWIIGTPIWTTDEFIEMITTNNNTGTYTLATNLDFNYITPASWTNTDATTFEGVFYGGNRTIKNIDLDEYRGIFGVLEGATVRDLIIENVSVDYTTTTNITSGLLAGRMQGTNNLVEYITIKNGTMNNDNVLAGGLIGYVSPTSGTGSGTIRDIHIDNTTVSGGYNSASYGNGGLIATVNNFTLTIEDVYVDADVTSTSNGNTGGLIGTVNGSSILTINNANVDQATLTVQGTGTTLGAGGAIGKLTNRGHDLSNIQITNTTITSASQSGGIGGVIASLNDYTLNLTDANVSSTITTTANNNAGGIVGYVNNSGVLEFDDITIDQSTISASGATSVYGSGGIIGVLLGDGHQLNQLRILDTNITNKRSAGGVIGRSE